MNKKIWVIGIALIMLCMAAAVVFADAGVTYTDHTVTVWNTGKGTLKKVELCVIYIDATKVRQETSIDFSDVTKTKQTKSFNAGKVIGAYSTYCSVPTENGE